MLLKKQKLTLLMRKHKLRQELDAAKAQAAQLIEQANRRAAQLVEEARTKHQLKVSVFVNKRKKLLIRNQCSRRITSTSCCFAVTGAEKILNQQVDAEAHNAMLTQLAAKL
jgi:F-type H+-transporting ATPase subunit b